MKSITFRIGDKPWDEFMEVMTSIRFRGIGSCDKSWLVRKVLAEEVARCRLAAAQRNEQAELEQRKVKRMK